VAVRRDTASSGTRSTGIADSFLRLWRTANERIERARLEYVFVVIALVWGVAQVFIVPPLQVPDEGDHWFRAWALTDGQLTADRSEEHTCELQSDLNSVCRLLLEK